MKSIFDIYESILDDENDSINSMKNSFIYMTEFVGSILHKYFSRPTSGYPVEDRYSPNNIKVAGIELYSYVGCKTEYTKLLRAVYKEIKKEYKDIVIKTEKSRTDGDVYIWIEGFPRTEDITANDVESLQLMLIFTASAERGLYYTTLDGPEAWLEKI